MEWRNRLLRRPLPQTAEMQRYALRLLTALVSFTNFARWGPSAEDLKTPPLAAVPVPGLSSIWGIPGSLLSATTPRGSDVMDGEEIAPADRRIPRSWEVAVRFVDEPCGARRGDGSLLGGIRKPPRHTAAGLVTWSDDEDAEAIRAPSVP